MTIRTERPEEFAALYDFIKTAFSTAQVADGDEQEFTDRLRAGGGYIPQLGLVAQIGDRIAGHILFTRFGVKAGDGSTTELLLVAPLSVALEFRSQGVGSALMREGLRRAAELGFKAALLVGDPAYYGRFGFRQSTELGIHNADGIPDRYVQAIELTPGALQGTDATATFAGM